MIWDLKPYPKYKDSGVAWLGKVPEHWEVRRLKYLLRERDSRSTDGSEPLLSVSQYTGVTKRSGNTDENPNTRAASLVGYKRVMVNDLVVNIMLAWNGSIGVSHSNGIVSPSYCVYRFNSGAFPGFFHYLLRSPSYKTRIKALSTGVVDSRLRLYTDDLYRLEGLLPPLPEQTAIVRFLDWADRRIRRVIRARQRRIKLLEEYKQVLINQAVTGRIDVRTGKPHPKYKHSGVEWLGEVPEHWAVRKLWTQFRKQGSGMTPTSDHYYGGEVPWVMTGDLNDGVVTATRRTVTTAAVADFSALRVFPPGSLLVAMYGATIGRTGVIAMEACTNQACCVFYEPTNSSLISFLQIVVNLTRSYLIEQAYGGGQPNINAKIVRALRVPVPPLHEQTAIVEFLGEQTEKIDAAIAADRRVIDLLEEFRTRLIADVVTGKIDVREAAARLPDELEPDSEIDALESDENADTFENKTSEIV